MSDPTPSGPGEVIHLVGPDVTIDGRRRQRCSWCGVVLLDDDLTRIAVAVMPGEEPTPPGAWPVGALLAHDGPARWVVEPTPHPSGDGSVTIPRASCMALAPDLSADWIDAQSAPRSLPPEWERLRVEVKALEVAAYEGYGSESIIEGDAFRSVLDLMDAIAAEAEQ